MQKEISKVQFEQVYQEHYRFVLMLCFSYFQDMSQAEDTLQDVFLKFLMKQPQLANSFAVHAWLYKTSKNLCISQLRKRKISDNLELNQTVEEQSESFKIRQIIYDLPEKHRIVIILFYYEGYAIKEISQILKISSSAVKKRLERARDKIKVHL